jgi:hypothetical protein
VEEQHQPASELEELWRGEQTALQIIAAASSDGGAGEVRKENLSFLRGNVPGTIEVSVPGRRGKHWLRQLRVAASTQPSSFLRNDRARRSKADHA